MADILLDVKVQGTQDVIKAERALVKVQNSAKRLATEMDKGRLSSQAYFKGQTQLVSVLTKAGFSYKEARDAVFQYTKAMRASDVAVDQMVDNLNRATAAQNNLNNASQRSTRGIGQMSTMVQQSGYQIGDFLVQVQSGTNWMVAFGQQATQIAGTLTLFGGKMIAIGTALGIAIPLLTALGAAWMRTRETGSDLADEITRIDKELKKLVKTKEAFSKGMTLDQLFATDELSRVRGELESIRAVYESLSAETIGRSLLGAIPGAAALGLDDAARLEELRELEARALQRIADLEKKIADERLKRFQQQEVQLLQEVAIKQMSLQFGEESLAVQRLQNQQELENLQTKLEQEGLEQDQIERLLELLSVSQDLTQQQKDVADEAERFSTILKMADLSHLVNQSASLAANMADAANNAAAALAARTLDVANAANIQYAGRGTTSSRPAFQMDDQGRVTTVSSILRDQESARGKAAKGSSKQSPIQQAEEYLQKLEREAEFKSTLVGLSDEQVAIETRREQLVNQLNGYEEGLSDAYTQRIEEIIKTEAETRKLIEAEQQREQLMNTIEGHIENAFMSMVDGSKSVEDAFKSMLRNIILAIYQEKVAKAGANAIMNLLGLANGGAFERGGKFTAYANGGVVGSPTMFSHSGGLGVMGEAGPEAIMPLKRGKNGKLGVQMEGSSQPVVVNNNFNISANGDDSVKRIVRGEIPRITEATKAAVVDAKRRGGTYGRSF
jgi:hypothetical protein